MKEPGKRIGAVVLAAGRSTRMGRQKLTLPWGGTTVIGQVIVTLQSVGVDPIAVVTGGAEDQVLLALNEFDVLTVTNPYYMQREMLVSLQAGLRIMPMDVSAILVCLGDQPQMEKEVVYGVVERYQQKGNRLVVPSYQMHRGHPWLVVRDLWDEILSLDVESSLRQFLNTHSIEIDYLDVLSESIFKDLDTPEEYAAEAP